MIRINLLPVKAERKKRTGLIQLASMALSIGVVGLVLLGVNLSMSNQLDTLREDIQKDEQEIARLEKIIGEVNQYEDQKKKLQSQLKVIEELERGKSGPVKVMDALASGIPKRVWIDSFDEKSGLATITGFGLEMADVSEFLKSLEKSPYFTEVTLKFTENAPQKGIQTFRFQVTTKVNYAI